MKKGLPLLLVFAALSMAALPNPTLHLPDSSIPQSLKKEGEWTIYMCNEGNFVITTPGIFKKKDLETETKIGKLTAHTFYFWDQEKDADNHLYQVTYTDYPPGIVHSDSTALLAEFWAATVDEATRSLGASTIYSGAQPFGEWPGMAWRLTYNRETVSTRARAFLVKNRLYVVQTICKADRAMNTSSDKFMDSFRLMN